jgi:hypothetical protein
MLNPAPGLGNRHPIALGWFEFTVGEVAVGRRPGALDQLQYRQLRRGVNAVLTKTQSSPRRLRLPFTVSVV